MKNGIEEAASRECDIRAAMGKEGVEVIVNDGTRILEAYKSDKDLILASLQEKLTAGEVVHGLSYLGGIFLLGVGALGSFIGTLETQPRATNMILAGAAILGLMALKEGVNYIKAYTRASLDYKVNNRFTKLD